jgi:hypothetical protein
MNSPHSIPRKRSPASPNSFAELRKTGIAIVQEMCGELWTDYNLHDPGVTILEQLCFALTDLVYRSDFPVEDQLTGEDGKIDFSGQSLHFPEEILPCRASTTADYRQAILACSPSIEDVWLDTGSGENTPGSCAGIYNATIKLAADGYSDNRVLAELRKTFIAQRNLCEDISESIHISENVDCLLVGMIEIDGFHETRDVLAHIYDVATSYIAADLEFRPLHASEEGSLEDVFNGPYGLHQRARQEHILEQTETLIIANLVRLLQDVDGVVRIHKLSVEISDPEWSGPKGPVKRRQGNRALRLRVPGGNNGGGDEAGGTQSLQLLRNGKLISAPIAETRSKYQQLRFAKSNARTTGAVAAMLYELPQGENREFDRYFSIQSHFPDTYGVNDKGVLASASTEDRARARQLKAYLLLFEQVMANYAANVDGIRDLFSSETESGPTYRYQVLDNRTVAGADQLYHSPAEDFLDEVIEEFDDRAERKSRQLDYMLAVFGEQCLQKSLRHFDCYSSLCDPQTELVRNKAAYLRSIVEVTRDRIGGLDYSTHGAVSGFAKRVGLLLGFRRHGHQLTEAARRAGLDSECHASHTATPESGEGENKEGYVRGISRIRLDHDSDTPSLQEAQLILKDSEMADSLLDKGVAIGNYRMVNEEDDRVRLELCTCEHPTWQALSTYDDEEEAAKVANALQYYAVQLASEGLHVLEHLLLRPFAGATQHAGQQPRKQSASLWQQFYPLRFSAFFPTWTERCRNANFRLLAEETIRINSPAHVYGQCFWLDYEEMSEFEQLFSDWAGVRQQTHPDQERLDDCSVGLIDFVTSKQDQLNRNEQR